MYCILILEVFACLPIVFTNNLIIQILDAKMNPNEDDDSWIQ